MARVERDATHTHPVTQLVGTPPNPIARGELPEGIVGEARDDLHVVPTFAQPPREHSRKGRWTRLGVIPLREDAEAHAPPFPRRYRLATLDLLVTEAAV